MKQTSADELIDLVINNPDDISYVQHQLAEEGPRHKQELSALLLSRILKLVKITEEQTASEFTLQDGFEFTTGNEKVPVLPVLMPIVLEHGQDVQAIADQIAQAPEHELLAFSICLQGIEWVINRNENR